jgi:hypothetical protein
MKRHPAPSHAEGEEEQVHQERRSPASRSMEPVWLGTDRIPPGPALRLPLCSDPERPLPGVLGQGATGWNLPPRRLCGRPTDRRGLFRAATPSNNQAGAVGEHEGAPPVRS